MLVYALILTLANAKPHLGIRMDLNPKVEDTERFLEWTPWLTAQHQQWLLKGSLQYTQTHSTTRTSESTARTNYQFWTPALEVEYILPTSNIAWHIGFGIESNLPMLSQTSSLFTETEQNDLNTQLSNAKADLAYTQIRLPLIGFVPVHTQFKIGLGLLYTYTAQRTKSDFETLWYAEGLTTPTLCLQFQ